MQAVSSTELDNSELDHALHMRRAVSLAENVLTATPNPRVGCVLVGVDNEVVGEGLHQVPGEAHAEINALAKAGEQARGGAAYITLEPCSHHGKTPPCAEALIEAGLGKVFIGSLDPFPEVAGKGVEMLEQAGIQVTLLKDFETRVQEINPGYMKRLSAGLPYVTCKMAMSLDGRTAAANRESKWITGPEARAEVQRLRAGSCAIVTGVDTILTDDPSLTVRPDQLNLSETETEHNQFAVNRQPLRIILDSKLRTPESAQVFSTGGEIKIFTTKDSTSFPGGSPANTEVIQVPELAQNGAAKGRVDPHSVLDLLASRFHVNEVLLEAGPTLSGAFIKAGLVDQLVVYIGANLLGSNGLPLFELPELDSMSEQMALEITDVKKIGGDCRIVARFASP